MQRIKNEKPCIFILIQLSRGTGTNTVTLKLKFKKLPSIPQHKQNKISETSFKFSLDFSFRTDYNLLYIPSLLIIDYLKNPNPDNYIYPINFDQGGFFKGNKLTFNKKKKKEKKWKDKKTGRE